MTRLSARYSHLVKMCRMRGCSREDAQELVQEAYLRLFEYQRSTRVRDADSLLRRILINLSINYFHRTLSTPFSFEDIDERDRREALVEPAAGPERALAAEQDLAVVVDLLNAVSERVCRIFIAQRMGYSHDEIATAFGIMPRTVEKHVVSANSALREMLPAAFAKRAQRT
ncbi:MAG: RNA polymerase sigma factor [Steroidobacteraceae bacterium]